MPTGMCMLKLGMAMRAEKHVKKPSFARGCPRCPGNDAIMHPVLSVGFGSCDGGLSGIHFGRDFRTWHTTHQTTFTRPLSLHPCIPAWSAVGL